MQTFEQLRQFLLLSMTQAFGGLLQQQKNGFTGQRACHFQHALLPQRQGAGKDMGRISQSYTFTLSVHFVQQRRFLVALDSQQRADQTSTTQLIGADRRILYVECLHP